MNVFFFSVDHFTPAFPIIYFILISMLFPHQVSINITRWDLTSSTKFLHRLRSLAKSYSVMWPSCPYLNIFQVVSSSIPSFASDQLGHKRELSCSATDDTHIGGI